jgi:hypothetical protein
MALNVDWPLAQSLFQEGVSLKGIAARTGIPYQALHKHSKRYNWQVLTLAPQVAQSNPHRVKTQTEYRPPCPPIEPNQAAKWQSRILETANRHLDNVFDKSTPEVDIDTLEKLARVLNATDLTARRALGLDIARSDHHFTLQVQSELPAQRQLEDRNEILEVETVPNQDTKPDDSAK